MALQPELPFCSTCGISGLQEELQLSDGVLYGVLLILGIVGAIVTFFTTKTGATGLLSLDFIIDTIGLYYLAQVRKENK